MRGQQHNRTSFHCLARVCKICCATIHKGVCMAKIARCLTPKQSWHNRFVPVFSWYPNAFLCHLQLDLYSTSHYHSMGTGKTFWAMVVRSMFGPWTKISSRLGNQKVHLFTCLEEHNVSVKQVSSVGSGCCRVCGVVVLRNFSLGFITSLLSEWYCIECTSCVY